MKKDIEKTKCFEITKFELLDSNENNILKGGFITFYNEMLLSGGKLKPANPASGCGCNGASGCACSF